MDVVLGYFCLFAFLFLLNLKKDVLKFPSPMF